MNSNKISAWILVAATMLLAVMGCWFCWHCPSRIYEVHELFWRQLAWNVIGITAFVGAWAFGWKRLLKAAPWLMAAWLLAFGVAQASMAVRGTHRWVSFGPIRVNVVTCFMPVFALFVAWLHERKLVRPWMERTTLAVVALCLVWMIVGNEWRMDRLVAFLNPEDQRYDKAYMSYQLSAALSDAKWFGCAGKDLALLPCPESDGMMSAAALMFGKWFPSAIVVLFAVSCSALGIVLKYAENESRRRYVLLFGLWLIVPTAYCLLHSFALLPVAGMSPALVSYGGTAVVMAWFGLGTLMANTTRYTEICTGQ